MFNIPWDDLECLWIKCPCGNFNFLCNRIRSVSARENPNPVVAAGCQRTSQEGESEDSSLFDEFQAQVSTSHKGKRRGDTFPRAKQHFM